MLFTAMLLSLTQRSSHRRLQSHSRNVVWNSLETDAALKDLLALSSSSMGGIGGCWTHRDFRDTRLSKVP